MPALKGGDALAWELIDTVLLDMDGTLLDRRFDDEFWLEHVPGVFARERGLDVHQAKEELFRTYAAQEGTLNWTDIDYWSDVLGLDIIGLKHDLVHLVALHPFVPEFLQFLQRGGKDVWLVTDAHPKNIKLKMSSIDIKHCFNGILTSHDVGFPKQVVHFWERAAERIGFRKGRTLFADDTVAVLKAAEAYGIGHLLHIARFSSVSAPVTSKRYRSIENFSEVMPPF